MVGIRILKHTCTFLVILNYYNLILFRFLSVRSHYRRSKMCLSIRISHPTASEKMSKRRELKKRKDLDEDIVLIQNQIVTKIFFIKFYRNFLHLQMSYPLILYKFDTICPKYRTAKAYPSL